MIAVLSLVQGIYSPLTKADLLRMWHLPCTLLWSFNTLLRAYNFNTGMRIGLISPVKKIVSQGSTPYSKVYRQFMIARREVWLSLHLFQRIYRQIIVAGRETISFVVLSCCKLPMLL